MLDPEWRSRVIEVLNKADLLGGPEQVEHHGAAVPISAITGDGLPELMGAIDAHMVHAMELLRYSIPVEAGEALAWLYQHGEVVTRDDYETHMDVLVRLREADHARFDGQFGDVVRKMES